MKLKNWVNKILVISVIRIFRIFYQAHINHFPIRIKIDDIWLLIAQSFSYHANLDSEKLRNKLLNLDGKKELICKYKIEKKF